MRLRKQDDSMQEEEILLIAQVSDALAHPARIKIFRYIMQANKAMAWSVTKTWSNISTMRRPPYHSIRKNWPIPVL